MKICFFADTFFPLVGGAEMVLHHLASQLTAAGEDVVVLAPRIRGQENRNDYPYPVHRYSRPSSKRFGVRQVLVQLGWRYLRQRFDLLHCHSSYPTAYVGATFKRWFRVPFVVRPHGADILPDGRMRRHPHLQKRIEQSLEKADAVIAQGDFLRRVIRELGVEEERIHTIHNGVDLELFAAGEPFDHPRPYVLALGNLSHRKGMDILLNAWARLEAPRADLLIAGPGVEKDALESQSRTLGLGSKVRFLGPVSGQKKVNLYRSAEFFVCPSRSEPFANVILEALAAGLPVVASAVGGNTELVRDGQHGLLFPSDDDQALATTLDRLLGDAELAARLRKQVPAFISAFAWPVVARQYLDLYRKVLG